MGRPEEFPIGPCRLEGGGVGIRGVSGGVTLEVAASRGGVVILFARSGDCTVSRAVNCPPLSVTDLGARVEPGLSVPGRSKALPVVRSITSACTRDADGVGRIGDVALGPVGARDVDVDWVEVGAGVLEDEAADAGGTVDRGPLGAVLRDPAGAFEVGMEGLGGGDECRGVQEVSMSSKAIS